MNKTDKLISLKGLTRFKQRIFGEIPEVSNPNLLDNPNFKINQRLVNGDISLSGEYFVDRWALKGKVQLTDSGIISIADSVQPLTGTVTSLVYQFLEDELVSFLMGKKATLSIYDDAGNFKSINFQIRNTNPFSTGGAVFPNGARIDLYRWSSFEGGRFMVLIELPAGTTVSEVKLELGDHATPFVPPHPTTELMKCQRYYQTGYVYGGVFVDNPSAGLYGSDFKYYPVKMRAKPQLKVSSISGNDDHFSYVHANGLSEEIPISAWTYQNSDNEHIAPIFVPPENINPLDHLRYRYEASADL